ncbi:MAG: hypothetical protein WCV82_04225 [Candidatus Paceibacterota bacterium]
MVVGFGLILWSIHLYAAAKCGEGGMLLVLGPNADYPFKGYGTGDMIDQMLGYISISHIAWLGLGCLATSLIALGYLAFKNMLGVLGSQELSLKRATFVYLLPTVALMAGVAYLVGSMLNCG